MIINMFVPCDKNFGGFAVECMFGKSFITIGIMVGKDHGGYSCYSGSPSRGIMGNFDMTKWKEFDYNKVIPRHHDVYKYIQIFSYVAKFFPADIDNDNLAAISNIVMHFIGRPGFKANVESRYKPGTIFKLNESPFIFESYDTCLLRLGHLYQIAFMDDCICIWPATGTYVSPGSQQIELAKRVPKRNKKYNCLKAILRLICGALRYDTTVEKGTSFKKITESFDDLIDGKECNSIKIDSIGK